MLSGLNLPECRMNVGKTLFAQVMEFVPWKTFGRIIDVGITEVLPQPQRYGRQYQSGSSAPYFVQYD
jgi:hypothetical protein